MNKYGQATETDWNPHCLHGFHLHYRREFTPDEKAGLNEVLHTIVHTAQFEFIETFLEEFNKELNAATATMVSKLTTVFKKF